MSVDDVLNLLIGPKYIDTPLSLIEELTDYLIFDIYSNLIDLLNLHKNT